MAHRGNSERKAYTGITICEGAVAEGARGLLPQKGPARQGPTKRTPTLSRGGQNDSHLGEAVPKGRKGD